MFIMQDSVPRGFLCQPDDQFCQVFCLGKDGGKLKSLPESFLLKRAGSTRDEFMELMAELWSVGVPSKTESGVVYSRRMVRDEALRKIRADAGMKGAKATLLKQKKTFADDFATAKHAANSANDNDTANGSVSNSLFSTIESLKRCIERWFNLPEGRVWPNDEERFMVEIAKRPTFAAEVIVVGTYHARANGYFPKSTRSLLERWDHHVQVAAAPVPTEGKPRLKADHSKGFFHGTPFDKKL
jgi:hypothetical protein